MQYIIQFNLSPKEYKSQFNYMEVGRPEVCSNCKSHHSFYRHGCYWRNILTSDYEESIPIARFCCKSCKTTVSILPSFALPYFQYSLAFIVEALNIIFLAFSKIKEHFAPLFRFYRKRFIRNLNKIVMFFRDEGWIEAIPPDEKEKAIKMICMLTVPTAETFSQRFHQHYKLNFMAY